MEGISNVIQNGLRHTFGNSGGEKQVLCYPYFPLSAPSFSVRALKFGTFTNVLRLSLKGEKRRFIVSVVLIMNGIPLRGKSI